VPSEHRKDLRTDKDRQKLWKWYDRNVIDKNKNKLELVANSGKGKTAFMCLELDPTKCHRHRIAKYLESKGLKGLDI
jgi:uncharacterized protein (DUF488 family)